MSNRIFSAHKKQQQQQRVDQTNSAQLKLADDIPTKYTILLTLILSALASSYELATFQTV